MMFLNGGFCLTKEMIDYAGIDVDAGERYFIPIQLSKIKDEIKNHFNSDLISEIYISAFCDLSDISVIVLDVCGGSHVEPWTPKEEEVDIIKEIIEELW